MTTKQTKETKEQIANRHKRMSGSVTDFMDFVTPLLFVVAKEPDLRAQLTRLIEEVIERVETTKTV